MYHQKFLPNFQFFKDTNSISILGTIYKYGINQFYFRLETIAPHARCINERFIQKIVTSNEHLASSPPPNVFVIFFGHECRNKFNLGGRGHTTKKGHSIM